jgi:subtilisin-like proprotein convertase family protein
VPITSPATAGTQGPVGTGNLVVGASQTITSMFAKIRVAHTWQGDARIELKHPDGTTIDLVTRPGASPPKLTNNTETGFSTDNYGNPGTGAYMTFIDSAAGVYDNAVGFPGPPAGTAVAINNPVGPYRAHGGSLNSTFGGKNVNGTWQVLGSDYWPGDEGTIDAVAVCLPAASGSTCYPNCDGSTVNPCLNVGDFSCFLNSFASGASYANCDNSTTPPVLNVGDFSCFLNAFASGCSSC